MPWLHFYARAVAWKRWEVGRGGWELYKRGLRLLNKWTEGVSVGWNSDATVPCLEYRTLLHGKGVDACTKIQTSQDISLMLAYIVSYLLFLLRLTASHPGKVKNAMRVENIKTYHFTLILW